MIDEHGPTGSARLSDDRKLRYRLVRATSSVGYHAMQSRVGLGTIARVVFVMLNPSTANAFRLDPTVTKCVAFAQRWGADVLEVVNLYAFRSPDPRDLYAHRGNPHARALLGADAINDREILEACTDARRVIAAWGNGGRTDGRGAEVRAMLVAAGVQLEAFRITNDGEPVHPLARGKHVVSLATEPQKWAA